MDRSRVCLSSVLLTLAALVVAPIGSTATHRTGAAAPAYNLTGVWTSPSPGDRGGTRIKLRQRGITLFWTGGPNDRAWIQTFEGKLHGATFSGEFKQDAPDISPPRYRGTMTAAVLDSCRFRFTSIVQEGMPTLSGIVFTKEHCTLGHYRFGFRIANRATTLSAGSSGSFTTGGQPDRYGSVDVTAVKARNLSLTWTSAKGTDGLTFGFTGTGRYDPGDHLLVLDLTLLRPKTSPCRDGSRDAELDISQRGVTLALCHLRFDYPAPKRATSWISQA
jgi:hypothetical protein